jgi:hypothetical protein
MIIGLNPLSTADMAKIPTKSKTRPPATDPCRRSHNAAGTQTIAEPTKGINDEIDIARPQRMGEWMPRRPKVKEPIKPWTKATMMPP